MAIEPDTKDWTWVLEVPCDECGFDPAGVEVTAIAERIAENLRAWDGALQAPDASLRPAPDVWSPLEYACHVRDVHRIFGERVRLMLSESDPSFANWDQDETAVRESYGEQDPATVAAELAAAASRTAAVFAAVTGDQWSRAGYRSNGSAFTVATLGVYYLHDLVHHVHDIGR